MIAKLHLIRSASVEGIKGVDFSLRHPLTGLAVAGCLDGTPYNLVPPSVYSDLVAAGLPSGVGILPANLASYAVPGLYIIGPQGTIPFTVKSAQHRVQANCVYNIPSEIGVPPALTSSNVSVLNSALWQVNVQDLTFGGFNTPGAPKGQWGPISCASIMNAGQIGDIHYDIAPENNSFATANASELNVPGYTAVERLLSDEGTVTGVLATINETFRYRQTANGVGRLLGNSQNLINWTRVDTQYQSTVMGAAVTSTSAGVVNSLYEIEISDSLLGQATGLGGKIYAVIAGSTPSAWVSLEEYANNPFGGPPITYLGNLNASPYFDSGNPVYLYIDLQNPGGTAVHVSNSSAINLYDQFTGASGAASCLVGSTLAYQSVTDNTVNRLW